MAARVVILTGERGVGKSTVCHQAVILAQDRGYICGGLITLSHPDGARDVLDVRSGNTRRLTLPPDAQPAVIQGRFRFDPATMSWGNEVLAQVTPCPLLVVDELGPLEIEPGAGWTKAFGTLYGGHFTLALVVIRPELLVPMQVRLPPGATTVLTVTSDNRDVLPPLLAAMLDRECGEK